MRRARLLASIATVASPMIPGSASGEPSVEVAGGIANSIADHQWDSPDIASKLAVRGVDWIPHWGGLVGVDWSHQGGRFDRFRLVGGVRFDRTTPDWTLSARFGGGLDLVTVDAEIWQGTLQPPVRMTRRQWSPGIAGDIAGSALIPFGRVDVGLELGLPLSYHFGECPSEGACFDYASIDVDILLVVRVR